MIYKISSTPLKKMADRFCFGKYGDEEYPAKIYCSQCGAVIVRNDEYYEVKSTNYCMACEDAAEKSILDNYRDRFIYTL